MPRVRTRRIMIAIAALVLVASLGLAARAPVAFQTIAALTEAPLPALAAREAVDIARIVRAIPDRGVAGTNDTVFAAHPAERYRRAIVEGFGNCSNLVKGLSWGLLRAGREFEVVYLLPIESGLRGGGHTVLRANLALPEGPRVGLVDVAAAAIPRVGAHVLDVGDLGGAVPAVHLDPLRPESEDWTHYYDDAFLRDAVVGRTSSAETGRWFRWLDAMYLDLGLPEKLDKMAWVGIGVVLGVFPSVHVADLEPLRSRNSFEFASMGAALWGLRIAPLVLLGCALSWLVERIRGGTVERGDFMGVESWSNAVAASQ